MSAARIPPTSAPSRRAVLVDEAITAYADTMGAPEGSQRRAAARAAIPITCSAIEETDGQIDPGCEADREAINTRRNRGESAPPPPPDLTPFIIKRPPSTKKESCPLPTEIPDNIPFPVKHRSFADFLDVECKEHSVATLNCSLKNIEAPKRQRTFAILSEESVPKLEKSDIETLEIKNGGEFKVIPEEAVTDLEKILVAIASLSRKLDFLVHYENINTSILNIIKKNEFTPLKIHPLSDRKCFDQNQEEHIFFDNFRKDKTY